MLGLIIFVAMEVATILKEITVAVVTLVTTLLTTNAKVSKNLCEHMFLNLRKT